MVKIGKAHPKLMQKVYVISRNLKETATNNPYQIQVRKEAETLKSKRRTDSTASRKVGAALLAPGILLLILSLYYESQILAFIGLGLTFWGALFLLITPKKYVEASLLETAAVPSYLTIDRIIKDLKYTGNGYYTPPYPKDVYIPEHLKGLKDIVVYISAENQENMPSITGLAESKFLLENPSGVLVAPPGLGLLTQIEKSINTDFAKVSLNELCELAPRAILENFSLAKEIEMTIEENQVKLKLVDSIYKNLYSSENNLKSISILGCPVVSAVACAIAKAAGKPVAIQKQSISPDGSAMRVLYQIV